MNRTDIEPAVVELLGTVLGHPVTLALARADEPGWDSLKHMQIVFAVEEEFGIQFTETEIPQLDSIRGFVEHLERRRAT